MEFRKLFSPTKINSVELKNRVVMPAFGLKYCGIDRKPSKRLVDFYEARAKGGCGLLVVGGVGIDLQGSGLLLPTIESDEFVPEWRRLANAVHRHDSKVFLQLFHAGRYQHSHLAKGLQAVAPSAVRSRYTGEEPKELTLEEIAGVQDRFVAAARRTLEAGMDGVEIIASAGYLICQFLSPVTNLRADDYGGSFENRCRFGRELLEKVRSAVGSDFPISVRMSGNDFIPGGNTTEEIAEICKVFEQAGADMFDVTGGWHETRVPQLPTMVPRGAYTYLAANVRRQVSVPVAAANRIVTPEQAEEVLRDGSADLVCIGRGQIADPEWTRKAQDGRASEIRPCVACLQGCMDRLFSLRDVECLCNPVAGHEAQRRLESCAHRLCIAVVGAGPAGLEAAVTATARGHQVTIFEESDDIGGQLPLVAAPPGRADFSLLLDYYRNEVKRLAVDVITGTTVTVEMLAELAPDRIILATGSRQAAPGLPGANLPHVVQAWDVLLGNIDLGDNVVVIGGGAVGVETAIAIADRGTVSGETLKFLLKHEAETPETLRRLATRGNRTVTILEMLPKIGRDIGATTRWVFLKELDLLGIATVTGATVTRITSQEVLYKQADVDRSIPADTVVLALGAVANNELATRLKEAGTDFIQIGDAVKPRKIMEAVHEGFLTAMDI